MQESTIVIICCIMNILILLKTKDREKEIKGWLRKKKENLINTLNPDWEFLNDKIEE